MVCRHARIWRDDILGKTIWIGRLGADHWGSWVLCLGLHRWAVRWGGGTTYCSWIISQSWKSFASSTELKKGGATGQELCTKKLPPASLSSREVTVTRAFGRSPRGLGDLAWPVFSWCGSFFSITLSPSTQQDTLSPSFLSPSGTGHLDHSLEGFV